MYGFLIENEKLHVTRAISMRKPHITRAISIYKTTHNESNLNKKPTDNESNFNEKTTHIMRSRTSDDGNGNHSVSLRIILIKIEVDQMLTSSYISSLMILRLISYFHECTALFWG